MKKYFFICFLLFAFMSLHSANASTLYTEDFDTLPIGEIETGDSTNIGDFYIFSGDSNITNENCLTGNCIEIVENGTTAIYYSTGIQNLLGTYTENYLSFYIKILDNDIDIDDSVTTWGNIFLKKFVGGTSVSYVHFCKTTDFTYSLVLSDTPTAINNCDNDVYGTRVGTGTFGYWEEVTVYLNSFDNVIGAKLNNSDYSTTSTSYDIIYGYNFAGAYIGDDESGAYYDDVSVSSYDVNNPFQLDYTLSAISESWTEEDIGCDIDGKDYCGIATTTYAIAIQGQATSTVENWKYEYLLTETDLSPIEPQSAYNKTIYFSLPDSIVRTDAIIFPDMEKRVYSLQVCVSPSVEFPIFLGYGETALCKNQFIGNGYDSDELRNLLVSLGLISSSTDSVRDNPSGVTLWGELDCDDIGITDIKKGVQCALIWAFDPPQSSIARFNTLKDNILSLYPIGYATLVISDFNDAIGTTTTEYFDSEIPIGELFGQEGGTTTIDFDNMLQYKDIGAPVFDWVEFIMWFGFVIWLIMWGTSRTL